MAAIIIEGPDGTGKSTLAQELVKRGWRYHHHSHKDFADPTVDAFEHYTELLLGSRGQNVVFDRLHPSELVYGPGMRNCSRISLEQFRLLNRLFFGLGGKIVFCDTSDRIIGANWLKRRGQEYVDDAGKLQLICQRYRRLRDGEFGNRWHAYDITCCSPGATVDWLVKGPWLVCPMGVIGSPTSKYLLVGERSSEPRDLAFYSDRQSAHFLTEALWEAGYQEHELAFTNALMHHGGRRDLRAIYVARPQVVITLGKVAMQVCYGQGVPLLVAPHPQYIKRFKLKQRGKYVELLRSFRGGVS